MFEQEIANAVKQVEKLLLTTQDTIFEIMQAIVLPSTLLDAHSPYMCRKIIQKAFRKKHGVPMSVWRQSRTGISDPQYKSMGVARKLNSKMQLAKKLLSNTQFTQIDVARLLEVTPAQIYKYLKHDGLTSKTYRDQNTQTPSIYTTQPATRRRIRVNGGLRLSMTLAGESRNRYRLDVTPNKAVLSLSLLGLSFGVSQIAGGDILTRHLEVTDPMLVKTGFLEPTPDIITASDPIKFHSPFELHQFIKLRVFYDVVEREIVISSSHSLRNISFTLLVTETDL